MSDKFFDSTPLDDRAEALANAWIVGDEFVPNAIWREVKRYRLLVAIIDKQPASKEPTPAEREQAAIWDRVLKSARTKAHVAAQADHQIRRIKAREEARKTLKQKMDDAIRQWRNGVRV